MAKQFQTRQRRWDDLVNTRVTGIGEEGSLVDTLVEDNDHPYPFIIYSKHNDVALSGWLPANDKFVEEKLHRHGAVLFRGFRVDSVTAFQELFESLGQQALPYMNRSSPRTEIVDKVYTSTDHPSDQAINMHNELSYSHEWPGKIMFCCLRPSETGGETPIADSRKVWAALSTATRTQFAEKGVMYVRRLGGGLGLPWQEVFQTSQRSTVEEECRRHDMDLTWQPNDRLLLRWKRPAIRQHPVTGEWVWFNHALFFSAASLDEIIASTLGHDNIPFNTCYGDGSPIPAPVIAEINQAFKTAIVEFKWQKGDVLYLDNHLMAHGREPFTGERKIAVIMWDKYN